MQKPPFSHSDTSLEAITEGDFETIACLADTIWRSHYVKIVSLAQIEYMLAERYTPDKLRAYINTEDRWMALLKFAGKPVGYCSYAKMSSHHEMKLEQLYVLEEYQGKGLGGYMLNQIETQTLRLGLRVLMLQVNRHNVNPIGFYQKYGFTIKEEAVFDIGNGFVMDDYILVKSLGEGVV